MFNPSAEMAQTGRKTLSGLPTDILLYLLNHVPTIDLICLALTSHLFYDLVLTAKDNSKLCETNTLYTVLDRWHLMKRLTSWVPTDHVLCSEVECKYIKGGERNSICSECR